MILNTPPIYYPFHAGDDGFPTSSVPSDECERLVDRAPHVLQLERLSKKTAQRGQHESGPVTDVPRQYRRE